MRNHILCVAVAASLLSPLSAIEAETIPLSAVGPAAQKTIQTQAAGGTLGDIDRVTEDSQTRYDVELAKNDQERDFSVAQDGTLLSIELALEETPAAVQKTIKSQLGDSTLESVEKTFEENGAIGYEVAITTKAGADRSFTVAADGKLESVEVGLEETSAAVRKTLQTLQAKGEPGNIYRTFDDGEVSYSVEVTQDGKKREYSVAESGKLESVQVFAQELPSLGQKTLRERIGAGKLIRIDKTFEDNNTFMYHVESRKDGRPFNFLIGPGGRFRGMEQ